MDVPQWHSALPAAGENANAAGATSGESEATDAGSIWRFAERVVQSSEDPDAEDEGLSGGHEGPIHPREADIEGFHFL